MTPNPGRLPDEARGKRVSVVFVNGKGSDTAIPAHWPADTLDWSIRPDGHPLRQFDIAFFEVVA